MPICDHCGTNYDKTFTVSRGGETWTFDSFECAITVVAPQCAHCHCRIIGHGVEQDGTIYCCAHCARESGATKVRDRA